MAAQRTITKRTNKERREESMRNILDHAEKEFAYKGYNGTTLNDVAAKAGVDTSLMRYYFYDKENLFAEVFRRRGPLINEARMRALDEYREQHGKEGTLEGVIDAFVRPGFEFAKNDAGYRHYAAIVAYVNSSKGAMHSLMSEVFDEVSNVFIEDMGRILPDAPREALYWGYHFLTGAFTFSLGQTGRIDRLSHGAVSSEDFVALADRLPVFAASGIRALCEFSKPPSKIG